MTEVNVTRTAKLKAEIHQKLDKHFRLKWEAQRLKQPYRVGMWHPSYPLKPADVICIFRASNQWCAEVCFSTTGLSLVELAQLQTLLNAKNLKIRGCGEDFGGSIGVVTWLEVTFIGVPL